VRAHEIRISARIAQNRPGEAIDVACEVLALLDVKLPRTADESAVPEWLTAAMTAMGDRDVHALAESEVMTDPEKLAAMRILASIASACYVAAPDVFPLVCFKQIELTALHGVTTHTAFALTTFGIIQGGVLGNLDVCYASGKAARRVLERTDAQEVEGRTRYVSNVYLDVWKTHVIDACEKSVEIRDRCLETGDLEFAAWSSMMRTIYAFFLGIPLGDAEPEAAREVSRIASLKQDTALGYAKISWQSIRNLSGLDGKPHLLEGEAYSAEEMLPQHSERGDHFAMASVHLHRLILGVLFEEREQARRASEALAPTLASFVSLHHIPTFMQFDALLALSDATDSSDEAERSALVERAKAHLEKLRVFAQHAPMNHRHRVEWLEAECAALEGKSGKAMDLFEKAIHSAAEQGWGLDEAFAAERCAQFLRRIGNNTAQRAYASEARYGWERIGARAKVDDVSRMWPDTHWMAQPTVVDNRTTRSFTTTSDRLDFRSILKSSQAISGEIRLDRLKASLTTVLLENGGAERAVIVLIAADGPRIESDSGATQNGEPPSTLVEESPDLPHSVLNYVLRSKANVVLSDAMASTRFEQDPYISRTQMRSILCAPMIRQGQLLGAIYLENSLVTGAFTLARIETLRALAAQAAIAIENASLYENLEDKVRQRTEELEVRNRFIKQTFGRYLSQDIVDNLLEDHSGLKLGGEQRKVTIMMADLRGFTSLSSRLSPPQVVSILNTYLSEMTEVIMSYQGTIDEFLGDAMLTIFGAPILREDDAERAVACAVAMQQRMEEVNRTLEGQNLPRVEMGIGVCTGIVVVGNIGSEKRAKYGVVGTAVNLAGRIESFTTGGQILIAETTRNEIGVELRVDAEIEMEAKGVREPVRILDIGGIGGEHALYLPAPIIILHPLASSYPCRLAKQEGKHATGTVQDVELTALGEREARLRGPTLSKHDDLRLWLAGDDEEPIYAKVIDEAAGAEDEMVVRFTSVPAIARGRLAQLLEN
jgi:class 3 adenylate cyclase